jgi:hypothetical protein
MKDIESLFLKLFHDQFGRDQRKGGALAMPLVCS